MGCGLLMTAIFKILFEIKIKNKHFWGGPRVQGAHVLVAWATCQK